MTLLDEINAMAKLAKTRELTPDEIIKRDSLRQSFLQEFRQRLKRDLDAVEVVNPDGSIQKLSDFKK